MNLAQCFVPHHMELRFLFFQTVQLAQRGMDVGPLRQQHLIAQHRFQHRHIAVPLRAKAFARAGFGQAGDRAHLPLSLIHISEPTRPQQLSRMPSSA